MFKLSANCPRCKEKIPTFRKPTSIRQGMWGGWTCSKCGCEIDRQGNEIVNSPPLKSEILGIVETGRVEESLGSDRRIIDNSKSSVNLTRKFSISKEWARTCSIEYEKAQVGSTELGIGIDEITSIKTSFEETIRKQYSISEETKEVYSEEIEIEVPSSIKLNLVFQWKRIWQCGFIKFRNQNNEELKVPFRVVVGVTFDQLQIDENS